MQQQRDDATLPHYRRRCCCMGERAIFLCFCYASHLYILLITCQSIKYKMLSYHRETALQGAL